MATNLGLRGFGSSLVMPSSYWMLPTPCGTSGTASLSFNAARAIPFSPVTAGTLEGVGLYVVTAGSAGTVIRFGIYDSGPGQDIPVNLVADYGTVSGTSSATMQTITGLSTALDNRLYWLVVCAQVGTTTSPIVRITAEQSVGIGITTATANQNCSYSRGSTTGALPATWGTISQATNAPLIHVRYS